jgi:uracil-DNA glycosylase
LEASASEASASDFDCAHNRSRSASASAWALPSSARWRPSARPGRTWPVVGVLPWRTKSTKVPGGGALLPRRLGIDGVAMSGAQPTVSIVQASDRHRTDSLAKLTAEIADCAACPRLVAWRQQVAVDKRAAFRDEEYWGRPVAGYGDPGARLLVAGLAPAAHGGNRTGRVFTGDRSGDWLFAALWRAGYANQPTSRHRDDGLVLSDCYVTAAVRCAPPANKPTPDERDRCGSYLARELVLLERLRVVVVLGQFALDACCRVLGVRPRPRFGHLAEFPVAPASGLGPLIIVCSFHPSQQNTFTGKLTEAMLDAVFTRARELVG